MDTHQRTKEARPTWIEKDYSKLEKVFSAAVERSRQKKIIYYGSERLYSENSRKELARRSYKEVAWAEPVTKQDIHTEIINLAKDRGITQIFKDSREEDDFLALLDDNKDEAYTVETEKKPVTFFDEVRIEPIPAGTQEEVIETQPEIAVQVPEEEQDEKSLAFIQNYYALRNQLAQIKEQEVAETETPEPVLEETEQESIEIQQPQIQEPEPDEDGLINLEELLESLTAPESPEEEEEEETSYFDSLSLTEEEQAKEEMTDDQKWEELLWGTHKTPVQEGIQPDTLFKEEALEPEIKEETSQKVEDTFIEEEPVIEEEQIAVETAPETAETEETVTAQPSIEAEITKYPSTTAVPHVKPVKPYDTSLVQEDLTSPNAYEEIKKDYNASRLTFGFSVVLFALFSIFFFSAFRGYDYIAIILTVVGIFLAWDLKARNLLIMCVVMLCTLIGCMVVYVYQTKLDIDLIHYVWFLLLPFCMGSSYAFINSRRLLQSFSRPVSQYQPALAGIEGIEEVPFSYQENIETVEPKVQTVETVEAETSTPEPEETQEEEIEQEEDSEINYDLNDFIELDKLQLDEMDSSLFDSSESLEFSNISDLDSADKEADNNSERMKSLISTIVEDTEDLSPQEKFTDTSKDDITLNITDTQL